MATVLVVEDDRTLRETLAYNLERQDYKVLAVGDSYEEPGKIWADLPDIH